MVAACSGSGSGTEVDVGAAPENPTADQLLLPLDAYLLLPTERAAYDLALSTRISICMSRQGFEYPVLPRPAEDGAQNASRYGFADPESVSVYGYHLPPRSAEVEALLASNSQPQSPEWFEAFNDPSSSAEDGPGGCLGEAYDALGGVQQYSDDTQFVEGLAVDSYNRSEQHDQVTDVIERWQDCLSDAGYADPGAPYEFASRILRQEATSEEEIDDPVVRDGTVVSEAERAAAQADARCQAQVNLVGIWFAVESAIQRDLIEDNAEALVEIQERNDERLRLAAQVSG